MKPTVEEIGNLLALKRHERPEDGYFDGFVREFHQRLREEEARQQGLAGWWRKASAWFSDLGASKWAYGGGLAYATVVAVMMTAPRGAEEVSSPAPTPVSHEMKSVPPAAFEQLDALDLRPSTQGSTGEQEF
ncbi:hypothetical protein OKA04_07020 [Luteolibacter flavescens]|uniref:Uncharacterized protein n=1 Tax=Luteolibacter flavescens TaxID=1859460 RepID=A0ABT3FLM7_9BACT|nr:hypothetical protein [Luteolibacter flavescens]MCW1884477.1 hypothetical protein [Luteolibacter flavescens]